MEKPPHSSSASKTDGVPDMKTEPSHEKPISNADMGSNVCPDHMSDPNSGSENGKVNSFDEASPKQTDGSPNVSKLVQKLKPVVQIPENHPELQEKTNTLDKRTENFESGLQQSWKLSVLLSKNSANLEKFKEKLNNFSNKAHSLPRFDGFMQNFG